MPKHMSYFENFYLGMNTLINSRMRIRVNVLIGYEPVRPHGRTHGEGSEI